jgi:hypothetical protein
MPLLLRRRARVAPPALTFANGYAVQLQARIPLRSNSTAGTRSILIPFAVQADELRSTGNGGEVTDASSWDVRLELEDGTKLPHKIVRHDLATGELAGVMRLDRNYAAATDYFIYAGKSGLAESEEDVAGVMGPEWLFLASGDDGVDLGGDTTKDLTANGDPITPAALGFWKAGVYDGTTAFLDDQNVGRNPLAMFPDYTENWVLHADAAKVLAGDVGVEQLADGVRLFTKLTTNDPAGENLALWARLGHLNPFALAFDLTVNGKAEITDGNGSYILCLAYMLGLDIDPHFLNPADWPDATVQAFSPPGFGDYFLHARGLRATIAPWTSVSPTNSNRVRLHYGPDYSGSTTLIGNSLSEGDQSVTFADDVTYSCVMSFDGSTFEFTNGVDTAYSKTDARIATWNDGFFGIIQSRKDATWQNFQYDASKRVPHPYLGGRYGVSWFALASMDADASGSQELFNIADATGELACWVTPSTGRISAVVKVSGTVMTFVSPDSSWNPGETHSVAVTWRSGEQIRMVLDGVEIGAESNSALRVGLLDITDELEIGRGNRGLLEYWDGSIALIGFRSKSSPVDELRDITGVLYEPDTILGYGGINLPASLNRCPVPQPLAVDGEVGVQQTIDVVAVAHDPDTKTGLLVSNPLLDEDSGGSISVVSNKLRYTPAAEGRSHIDYTLTDNGGNQSTGRAVVRVQSGSGPGPGGNGADFWYGYIPTPIGLTSTYVRSVNSFAQLDAQIAAAPTDRVAIIRVTESLAGGSFSGNAPRDPSRPILVDFQNGVCTGDWFMNPASSAIWFQNFDHAASFKIRGRDHRFSDLTLIANRAEPFDCQHPDEEVPDITIDRVSVMRTGTATNRFWIAWNGGKPQGTINRLKRWRIALWDLLQDNNTGVKFLLGRNEDTNAIGAECDTVLICNRLTAGITNKHVDHGKWRRLVRVWNEYNYDSLKETVYTRHSEAYWFSNYFNNCALTIADYGQHCLDNRFENGAQLRCLRGDLGNFGEGNLPKGNAGFPRTDTPIFAGNSGDQAEIVELGARNSIHPFGCRNPTFYDHDLNWFNTAGVDGAVNNLRTQPEVPPSFTLFGKTLQELRTPRMATFVSSNNGAVTSTAHVGRGARLMPTKPT